MKSYKTLAPAFLLLVGLTACHNKTGTQDNGSSTFELSGKLSGGGAGMPIYLDRLTSKEDAHIDSTKIGSDGTFTFHTKGITKGFYKLRLTRSDFAILILDSAEKVHVEGDAQFLGNTYTTTGSPDTKLFCELNHESKINYDRRDSLQKIFQDIVNTLGGNKKRLDSLNTAIEGPYDTIVHQQVRYITSFIKAHISSFASIAAIEQLSPIRFLPYYISLDSALSKAYPNSPYLKLAIGSKAPDISLPDTNGKIFNLSSLKGKTVLIDFWASWCGPCKASLPLVDSIFNKYKNRNFTILSVSLDKEKSDWLDAIHHFHLNWTHVSDLKYWNSKAVSLYNLDAIPDMVLVTPDGIIADKNIKEEDLDYEVGALLGLQKM